MRKKVFIITFSLITAVAIAKTNRDRQGSFIPPATEPIWLENEYISVKIDRKTGAVRSIRDKEQDVIYPFSGIGFVVTTDTGSVETTIARYITQRADRTELGFTTGDLNIKLFYQLGPEDRFIEKWLEVKSKNESPFFLKSLTLEDTNTKAFSDIHFHDDQTIWHCPINLFLRGEKGGCFAGLEYPYWDLKQKDNAGFRLGYSPNYQLAKGETNTSEKYFLGVYRKEGIHRVSQGPYPGRGRSPLVHWRGTGLKQHFKGFKIPSEVKDVPLEKLDWGEVWAMQDFMRHVLPDDLSLPEDGYWVWQNGWWAGLFNPKTDILDRLKSCGIHDIMTAHTWYGRGNHPITEPYLSQMRVEPIGFPKDQSIAGLPGPAGPAAGLHSPHDVKLDKFRPSEFTPDFIAPPAMENFLNYGRKIGVHVSSFSLPGIYFENKPEWAAINESGNPCEYLFGRKHSCWANDDYAQHMTTLHEKVFDKYKPRWWGWDGRMMNFWEVQAYRKGPKGVGFDPCYAKNHGHLPGDNLYKEWKNIQAFFKKLRTRYPKMCLEQYLGLKRGGPWALRYLNADDNYYETKGGLMNRLQTWHNQNDRFRPPYKNYAAIFGTRTADFRVSVISSISATSYCQVGPGFKGLALEENRDFLKKWRTWATENHKYLKVKRDLFQCPGDSAIDGSAHIIKDRGFIFLFCGGFDKKVKHEKKLCASIPINGWLGLKENPAAFYQIKQVYPSEGLDLGIYRYGDEFTYVMLRDSTILLSIVPVKAGTKTYRLETGYSKDQLLIIPAFENDKSL